MIPAYIGAAIGTGNVAATTAATAAAASVTVIVIIFLGTKTQAKHLYEAFRMVKSVCSR